jgi:hypothetical protein
VRSQGKGGLAVTRKPWLTYMGYLPLRRLDLWLAELAAMRPTLPTPLRALAANRAWFAFCFADAITVVPLYFWHAVWS